MTSRRITVKLAVAAALVALGLGLAVSLIQAALDLSREEEAQEALINRILEVAKPTAARAVIVIDRNLAQEVVSGILEYDFVAAAEVRDDLGQILAAHSRTTEPTRADWLVGLIAPETTRYSVPLVEEPVFAGYMGSGRLTITIDPIRLNTPFVNRVISDIGLTLLQALIFAFALMAIFHWLVTKPLMTLAGSFDRISPREPGMSPLPMPSAHHHDELGMVARAGNRLLAAIQELLHERRRGTEKLRAVTEAVSSVSGDNMLDDLIARMAQILEVDCTLVAVFANEEKSRMRTIAFYADGEKAKNFEYQLSGSPCEHVLATEICLYNGNVPTAFPDDQGLKRLGIMAYVGAPLFDSEENPIGLIVALHREPLDDPERVTDFLHMFGVRAAAELERANAEAQLRESEKRLRSILDNATAVIYVKDMSGRFVLANRQFERLFNLSSGTILGKTDYDLIEKEAADSVRKNDLAVLDANAPTEFEEIIPQSDGEHTYISIKFPLRDLSGKPYAICGISTDITARKKAETALATQTRNLQLAEEIANMGHWRIDAATRAVYFSEQMYRIRGFEPGTEVTWEMLRDASHPDDWELVERANRKAVEQKEGSELDRRIFLPDGTQRIIHSSSRVELDDDGQVAAVIGISQDITERKEAELKLRETMENLERSQQVAKLGSWVWDIEGDREWWSDEIYRIYGMEVGSVVMDSYGFLDYVHPDDRDDVLAALDRSLSTGEPYIVEYRLQRVDGYEIILYEEGELEYDADGKPIRMRGIAQDVTERRQAAEELEKAERRFRGIVENATDGIFRSTEDGHLLWANPALANMLGYATPDELLNATEHDATTFYVDLKDRETLIAKLKSDGAVSGFVAQGRRTATGEKFWFDMSVRAERDAAGKLVLDGVVRDITESRDRERRMRRVEKMQAIGQLTGGIAHDFNNLLGILVGNLDMLQEEIGDNPKLERPLATALRATLRGADLTKQLLRFSRQTEESAGPVNVNEIIRDMDDLLAKSLTSEVEIEMKLQEELWLTEISRGDFEDCLINLAMNARDAMPNGGKLLIETENSVIDAGTNSDLPPGDYIDIIIADNGSGMSAEVADRVFEPFFTTKEAGKGTGLGLSMVYGFVQRSNGQIRVNSDPGVGTTVRICLPRAVCTDKESAIPNALKDELPRGSEAILVVDDEPELVGLAQNMLESLGYIVFTASGGQAALDVLAKYPEIDVLFTDVVMPGGMGGLELAEQAKKLRPNLKVLITTGYSDKLRSHGPSADLLNTRISKPYRMPDLAWRLRGVIDKEDLTST